MPQINISQKLNTHTRFAHEVRETSAGFNEKKFSILKRAIVTGVNVGASQSGTSEINIGPYAITAVILDEDIFSSRPDRDRKQKWYQPLSPINNISIPEIGEEVFIIKEQNSKSSMGFWISRVNNTNQLSYYEARSWDLQNKKFGGQNIDIKSIRNKNSINYPSNLKTLPIAVLPGDTVQQGRLGTYIRHSVDLQTSFAVLEIGIKPAIASDGLQIHMPVLPATKTKSFHAENFSLSRLAGNFQFFEKEFNTYISDIDKINYKETGKLPFIIDNNEEKDSIINIAQRHYNISLDGSNNASPESEYLYRQVLGDRNKEVLGDVIILLKEMSDLNLDIFKFIKEHTHTTKEVVVEMGGTVTEDGVWSGKYIIEEDQTKPTLENTDIYTGDTIRNIDTAIEMFEDKFTIIEEKLDKILSKTQFVQ